MCACFVTYLPVERENFPMIAANKASGNLIDERCCKDAERP